MIKQKPKKRSTSIRRGLRDQQGTAVVEFAIVALPLFLLVFGILDFGRAMNYKNGLTSLANQAARYAIVNRDPTAPANPFPSCSSIKSYLQSQADTSELDTLIGDGVNNVSIDFDGLANQTGAGHPVTITVGVDFPWTNFLSNEGLGPSTHLRGTATMRIEQPMTGYTGSASC
jgi:Flp pilus assembly protein TadG